MSEIIHVKNKQAIGGSYQLDITTWMKTEYKELPDGTKQRTITDPKGKKYADFWEKNGKHELSPLLSEAESNAFIDKQSGVAKLKNSLNNATNWKTVVEDIVKECPVYYDKNQMWWIWNHERKCWEVTDETDLNNLVDEVTGRNTLKGNIKSQIIEAFKRIGRKNKPFEVPRTWVQFKNLIYDVATGEVIEPTSEYFLSNPIPHNLGKSTETPLTDTLLGSWGGEYSLTLKQLLAYVMLRDYPLHRIFLLIGSGSNGKGTYLRLLNNLVGTENVASVEMDMLLKNQFHITKLHKKLACQMSETNFSALSNTSMLKRLSGGDLVGFEYKNKLPFDDYNYAKIIVATNSLPVTHDKTDGFYRRWIIIDFKQQFGEKKDVLAEIPEIEYENLCLWCCKTLGSLLIEREFYKEGDIRERRERYEAKSNPLKGFLEAYYERSFDGFIAASDFYDHFSVYLQSNGHRNLSYQSVRNMMKEEGFEYERNRVFSDSNPVACIMGLKRKNNSVSAVSDVPAILVYPPLTRTQPKVGNTADTDDTNISKSTSNFEKSDQKSEYSETCVVKVTIEDILSKLIELDKGDGVDYESLYTSLKTTEEKIGKRIQQMLLTGWIFEPRNGKLKVLK